MYILANFVELNNTVYPARVPVRTRRVSRCKSVSVRLCFVCVHRVCTIAPGTPGTVCEHTCCIKVNKSTVSVIYQMSLRLVSLAQVYVCTCTSVGTSTRMNLCTRAHVCTRTLKLPPNPNIGLGLLTSPTLKYLRNLVTTSATGSS